MKHGSKHRSTETRFIFGFMNRQPATLCMAVGLGRLCKSCPFELVLQLPARHEHCIPVSVRKSRVAGEVVLLLVMAVAGV